MSALAPTTPKSSRRARRFGRRPRPTRWAAAAIALIAVLTVTLPIDIVVPGLAVGVVVGAIVIDVVVARRTRPEGSRTELPILALSVPIPFEVTMSVALARSCRVRQPVPPELGVVPDEQSGTVLRSELTGRHRGVHLLAPPVVRASGPLGLGSCDHDVGDGATVTVYPDLPKARRLAAARRRGRSSEEGRIRSRLGIGTEFETIRDYSPDDDIRQVNWVATSRVGRPMSNQYRIEENRDLMCVVDAGRLMASPVGMLTRLDIALDAVATLAVAAEEAGDRVGALSFAGTVIDHLGPRRRGAHAVVQTLFDLEPTEVESDYDRAFLAVGRQKRALIALFTDLVDESAARSLLAACAVLTRRHAVMIASCRDPELQAAVSDEPGDVRDVLRSVVALDLLASRNRATALLRAMGASVVEASPERLGAACVHAYLTLKQRARL